LFAYPIINSIFATLKDIDAAIISADTISVLNASELSKIANNEKTVTTAKLLSNGQEINKQYKAVFHAVAQAIDSKSESSLPVVYYVCGKCGNVFSGACRTP
jgi:hypothetical protein